MVELAVSAVLCGLANAVDSVARDALVTERLVEAFSLVALETAFHKLRTGEAAHLGTVFEVKGC